MKILVIDRSIVNGRLTEADNSFVKHLMFWSLGNNQIDVLARAERSVAERLKGKVNLLRIPPRLLFLGLFYSYAYLVVFARKYDLIVENWGNKPLLSFTWNFKRSLIMIIGKNFKTVLPAKIMRFIYKKVPFLVSSLKIKEELVRLGVGNENIKYVPDGVANHKKYSENLLKKKKNKIVIVVGKKMGDAISLMALIERKSLEWKFIALIEKRRISYFKNLCSQFDLSNKIKIFALSLPVFNKNITDSKFLVITMHTKDVSDYIEASLNCGAPVVLEDKVSYFRDKQTKDVVLDYQSPMNAAELILTLSKNNAEYTKLQNKILKKSRTYSWEEAGRLGLEFIESI